MFRGITRLTAVLGLDSDCLCLLLVTSRTSSEEAARSNVDPISGQLAVDSRLRVDFANRVLKCQRLVDALGHLPDIVFLTCFSASLVFLAVTVTTLNSEHSVLQPLAMYWVGPSQPAEQN